MENYNLNNYNKPYYYKFKNNQTNIEKAKQEQPSVKADNNQEKGLDTFNRSSSQVKVPEKDVFANVYTWIDDKGATHVTESLTFNQALEYGWAWLNGRTY